jgi:cytochrome d ubiquinol oxidase subunit I
MQTPAGHEIRDGIAYPADWLAVIFNPSFPYRFAHMFTAAYLTTSLVVLAVGARYLIGGRFPQEARTMMRMGLGMVVCLAPLQAVIGDMHGLNTAEHQPAKVAAIEAHWDGSKPAPLVLFAIPNEREERNDFEIAIPNIASFLITHDADGLFKGLKDFAPRDRPPVAPPFFAFRLMVGLGVVMIGIGAVGAFLWVTGRLFATRWYLAAVQYSWPLGFVAILAGWYVTETGRQPWIATGILRTVDAISPVSFGAVLFTLILFVLVYSAVFSMGIYYINRLIEKGPAGAAAKPEEGVPSRPLSAATEAAHEAIEGAK